MLQESDHTVPFWKQAKVPNGLQKALMP